MERAGSTTTVMVHQVPQGLEGSQAAEKGMRVPGGAVVPVAATQTTPGTTNPVTVPLTAVGAALPCPIMVGVDVWLSDG